MSDVISTIAVHPALLSFLGFAVGILSGLLGVGGGVVMTPVLHLLGMSIPIAVGTTLTQMVASSLSGAFKHFKQGNISKPIALIFGIPGLLGILLGKSLMSYLALSKELLEPFTLVYGGFLIFLAILMLRRQKQRISVKKSPSAIWKWGPQMVITEQKISIPVLQSISFSCLIGVISGLTGLGGGFFFMPIFSIVLGLPLKTAVGTSLGIVGMTSTMGALSYVSSGMVDLRVAMFLALGSIVGGYIGASVNRYVSVKLLKKQFAFLVMAAALSVFLKYFGYELIAIVAIGTMSLAIIATAGFQLHKNSSR